MKLALIADAHVANHKRWGGPLEGGVNRRGWECVRALAKASSLAAANDCDALFVLGDLFDNTRPSPALVAATAEALLSGGRAVHVLLGNHDRQSMHDNDQACASLDLSQGISVHAKPNLIRFGSTEVAVVPYQAGEAKDWLVAGLADVGHGWSSTCARRVALTHCGVWDDSTPAYLKSAKDAVGIGHVRWMCDPHRISFFAAGNWHERRSWTPREGTGDPLVTIPGTVCPHNFSDPQVHGAVLVWDSKHNSWHHTPIPAPLFLRAGGLLDFTVLSEGADKKIRNHYAAKDAARVYVRATVRRDELEDAMRVRARLVGEYGDLIVVHVEVREQEAEASVREAAKAAVRAGESRATLLDYADLASVEEPGTKEGVARRLAEYRKVAG